MKKTKLKERLENAMKAFFEVEEQNESLMYFEDTSLLRSEQVIEKKDFSNISTILRQAFLFFPGAVVLWITSLEFTTLLLAQTLTVFPWVATLVMVICVFLTTLGLGDLRKPKDYLVPISLIGFGGLFGIIATFLPNEIIHLLKQNNNIFWLTPLALIVPFIVKFLVEGIKKD